MSMPTQLKNSLLGLTFLLLGGSGTYVFNEQIREAQRNEYLQAVAADPDTSEAVKIAMVMGHYYESSNRHIGTPYVDRVGKGQPLTVCNGVTGKEVIAGKHYSPAECYALEKRRYIQAESAVKPMLVQWSNYDPFVQATFVDFAWNKGTGAFSTSTMRRKANADDLRGACRENPRWNRGTVNGVSKVLPGLTIRGESNDEICQDWRLTNG